jgi:predicted phage-related endonuclease
VVYHPDYPFLHATLDGRVHERPDSPCIGIMDAKFMLPFHEWSIHKALEKHYAQLQHNMMVTGTSRAWLSVITAFGGHHTIECEADFFYQVKLLRAEIEFWDSVQNGDAPRVASAEVYVEKPEPVKIVDMSMSNEWTVHAQKIVETLPGFLAHEARRDALKELMPDDAVVAHGHGVKLKRAKNNRLTFEIDGSKEAKKQVKAALAA